MSIYSAYRSQRRLGQRSRMLAGTATFALVAGMLAAAGVLAPAAQAVEPPPPPDACAGSPAVNLFTDPVAQPPVAAPDAPNHYTLTAHVGSHLFSSQFQGGDDARLQHGECAGGLPRPDDRDQEGHADRRDAGQRDTQRIPSSTSVSRTQATASSCTATADCRLPRATAYRGRRSSLGPAADQPLPEQPGCGAALVPRPRRLGDLVPGIRGARRVHAEDRQHRGVAALCRAVPSPRHSSCRTRHSTPTGHCAIRT